MEIYKPLIALLAIVNPIGVIPFFIHFTQGFSTQQRHDTARIAAISACVVIAVSALVTNLPDSPTLDSSGQLIVDFGGQLDVRGDADGEFRGNLMVRADYL